MNLASINLSTIKSMPVILLAAGAPERRIAILADQFAVIQRRDNEVWAVGGRSAALRHGKTVDVSERVLV